MEAPLKRALAKAVDYLESHDYRYAVIGGIANQWWGRPRFTYDVDIKVIVPNTEYSTVQNAIRATFPERARPDTSENPLIVDIKVGEITVDFLLAIPGYEENSVVRGVPCRLDELEVWICTPEDLIIQKAVASRARDWDDIEGILIEQRGRLDLLYIEDWLKQFAEVLEKPEILRQYKTIQEHISAVSGKNPKQ